MLFPAELINSILTYFNLTVESTTQVQAVLTLVLLGLYFVILISAFVWIALYVWRKVNPESYNRAKGSEKF